MATRRRLFTHLFILATICLLSCLPGQAAELKICVDSNDWAPYTFGRGEGTLQILVKMIAQQLDVRVEMVSLPWKRCEAEVETDRVNGLLGAVADAKTLADYAFPLRNGLPDVHRALTTTEMVLVKRSDSPVSWDGKHLRGLIHPVGSIFGYYDISDRLKEIGAPVDEGAFTTEQNAMKLIWGRSEVMATYTEDARRLLANPDFQGKLQLLPIPLGKNDYFLVFNRAFYKANRELGELIWNAIPEMKSDPTYLTAIERVR